MSCEPSPRPWLSLPRATCWLHQLDALTEVGNALTRELEVLRPLRLVAERLRELIGAGLVLIELPTAEADLEIRCADGEGATGLIRPRLRHALH